MTSKRIAQSDRQQKSDKPQESGILQRAAVRSVSDMQSTDDQEELALSNSAFSKDFSQVPISTTKPEQIMAKLMIGAVGDKYEQEADRVAAQVMRRINAPASVQSGEDETVQREEMETKDNEARLMRSPIIQRKSSDGGIAATPNLEASINRARSGGQPMANNIREPMEQAFGADLSGVKIHANAQSDELNRSIQARAFTTGKDVFFRQGAYEPGSLGGQELLAHELTHVVQQNSEAVQRSTLPPHNKNGNRKKEKSGKTKIAIQKTTESVIQAYGRINISETKPQVSKEEDVKNSVKPEEYVYLARGVVPTQRNTHESDVSSHSYVSHPKMLTEGTENISEEEVKAPRNEEAKGYVNQASGQGVVGDWIEFTTDEKIARKYAKEEGRYGYIHIIKIQKKYLQKGSTGAENGWIASQKAPYEIVHIEKTDRVNDTSLSIGGEDMINDLKEEKDAEFMRSMQTRLGQDPTVTPEERQKYITIKQRYLKAKKED
jgi:Domain of unknown function (DUF4157)